MDLTDKRFTDALEKYRHAAKEVAELHRQTEQNDRKRQKLLAIEAMDLIVKAIVNPLTNKPHSWTSAMDAVKQGEQADELHELATEHAFTVELAVAESKIAWATVLRLVRPSSEDPADGE